MSLCLLTGIISTQDRRVFLLFGLCLILMAIVGWHRSCHPINFLERIAVPQRPDLAFSFFADLFVSVLSLFFVFLFLSFCGSACLYNFDAKGSYRAQTNIRPVCTEWNDAWKRTTERMISGILAGGSWVSARRIVASLTSGGYLFLFVFCLVECLL